MHFEIWDAFSIEKVKALQYNHSFKKIILSTVGEIKKSEYRFLQKAGFYIQLDEHTPIPIDNQYKTPATLGRDRLAAVVGAFAQYPNDNIIVIDAGTCITTEIILKGGIYLGGNISPGIRMRMKAMHEFTAKLPLLRTKKPRSFVGYSTKTAMQNGGTMGAVWELEHFISKCEKKYGALKVILTGGDTIFFEKHLKKEIFAHSNLVLVGLNQILDYNAKIKQ